MIATPELKRSVTNLIKGREKIIETTQKTPLSKAKKIKPKKNIDCNRKTKKYFKKFIILHKDFKAPFFFLCNSVQKKCAHRPY